MEKALNGRSSTNRSDDCVQDFIAAALQGHFVPIHHGIGPFKHRRDTLVMLLIEHGKHVMCEKPMAKTYEEAKELFFNSLKEFPEDFQAKAKAI